MHRTSAPTTRPPTTLPTATTRLSTPGCAQVCVRVCVCACVCVCVCVCVCKKLKMRVHTLTAIYVQMSRKSACGREGIWSCPHTHAPNTHQTYPHPHHHPYILQVLLRAHNKHAQTYPHTPPTHPSIPSTDARPARVHEGCTRLARAHTHTHPPQCVWPVRASPNPPNHTLPPYRCGWPVRVHACCAGL